MSKDQNKRGVESVCMLVTDVDAQSGGVQRHSHILLKELSRRKIQAFVCARNYHKASRKETKDGAVFRRTPVLGNGMVINSLMYLVDTFIWLILNRKKYDVIHCQQMYAPAMIAALVKILIKKPVVVRVTATGELGEVKCIKQMPLAKHRLRLLKKIDRFVALTHEMKNEIETLDIDPNKIKVINNATDVPPGAAFETLEKTAHRRKLGIGSEKTAVYVGRLSDEKGLDVLIKAWRSVVEKHPSARLLFLGEGGAYRNVENQLRELTQMLRIEASVGFLGHVKNVKDYIMAADLFVLPSRTEGMSNSLVEAFACGATVLASDIPANLEICVDGHNSLTFSVGDEKDLSKKLFKLLENSELAEKLGRNARSFAEQKLSKDVMINKYIDLYQEIINAN